MMADQRLREAEVVRYVGDAGRLACADQDDLQARLIAHQPEHVGQLRGLAGGQQIRKLLGFYVHMNKCRYVFVNCNLCVGRLAQSRSRTV